MQNIDVIEIYQFAQASFNRIDNFLDQIIEDSKNPFDQQNQQSKQLQPIYSVYNSINEGFYYRININQKECLNQYYTSQELFNPQIEKDYFDGQKTQSRQHSDLQTQAQLSNELVDNTVQIDHNNVDNMFQKANKLHAPGKYEQAIGWYDKALAINPQFVESLYGKGNCLWSLGQYAQAIECQDITLTINSQFVESLHGKGNCLWPLGQYQQAIGWYDKALAINPQFVESLHGKALCHQYLNN